MPSDLNVLPRTGLQSKLFLQTLQRLAPRGRASNGTCGHMARWGDMATVPAIVHSERTRANAERRTDNLGLTLYLMSAAGHYLSRMRNLTVNLELVIETSITV